ncbi:restriction endonuclease subunit S [Helicobacter pylori]|uniref:restriction endonuclease subunit S n=1 Tax=Helicobacter pylori TaxID=210 RepID=UPI0013F3E1E0|nr:restriction endonuclease subunit S [Helicobacter pylori]NHB53560.1 restriction endonuclease subunit S [Helicobacter pylori]
MDALTTPLPKAWQKIRLGDIAEIKRGVRITKNELDVFGKYPVVSGGVGFLGYTNNFNRYENTITIAQYGTAGYVNFQKNKFWANDVCFCVYPNKDVIKNIFLYYFLKVNQNYLYEISNRNATPYSISKDKILDFEIPLPPLNEQAAIANVLSDLDRYLYSLDALILKKESVKKALSFELLSQRKRLKGFNQAWQKVRLGDIAEIIGGGTPSTQVASFWNGSINWFTPTEIGITKYVYKSQRTITPLGLKKSSAKLLPIGTILLTSRASIGDCAILKVAATTNQGFQSLIPLEKINNEFLYYLMLTLKNKLLKLASGSTFLEVSPNKIKNLLIPLPHLNEQAAIANVLSALDHEIISLKNKKRQFENIKKALNHDLMSAKIRVLKK